MQVEQYLHGRNRYGIKLGRNGDSGSGIGCLSRSDFVLGSDIAELDRAYLQYLSPYIDSKGNRPVIFKKRFLRSKNTALSSTAYVAPTSGDRATWVDHIFLLNAKDDEQTLNPECWMGLNYITDDPNELDESGKLKQKLDCCSLERLPAKEDFQLRPLREVLEMWKLTEERFLHLVEAVMDSTIDRKRSLLILYDINGKDCESSRFWDKNRMTAAQFNQYRMSQLLCWLYHMLPFSFRRLAGYDTSYDMFSNEQQIVFTPQDAIKVGAKRQVYISYPLLTPTGLDINAPKLRLLGNGYMYLTGYDIIHTPGGAELFQQKDSAITKFLANKVHNLMNCPDEKRRDMLEETRSLFKEMEANIGDRYCVNLRDIAQEIIRLNIEIQTTEELYDLAKKQLADGLQDVKFFERIISELEKRRATEPEYEEKWRELLEISFTYSAFLAQVELAKEFIKKLGDFIRKKYNEGKPRLDEVEASGKRINNAQLSGYEVGEWLICELFAQKNSPEMEYYLSMIQGNNYRELLEGCKKAYGVAGALPDKMVCLMLQKRLQAKIENTEFDANKENLCYLMCDAQQDEKMPEKFKKVVEEQVRKWSGFPTQLTVYQEVVKDGATVCWDVCQKLKTSPLKDDANKIRFALEDKAIDKWLEKTPPNITESINSILLILHDLNENKKDITEKQDKVAEQLSQTYRKQDPVVCQQRCELLRSYPVALPIERTVKKKVTDSYLQNAGLAAMWNQRAFDAVCAMIEELGEWFDEERQGDFGGLMQHYLSNEQNKNKQPHELIDLGRRIEETYNPKIAQIASERIEEALRDWVCSGDVEDAKKVKDCAKILAYRHHLSQKFPAEDGTYYEGIKNQYIAIYSEQENFDKLDTLCDELKFDCFSKFVRPVLEAQIPLMIERLSKADKKHQNEKPSANYLVEFDKLTAQHKDDEEVIKLREKLRQYSSVHLDFSELVDGIYSQPQRLVDSGLLDRYSENETPFEVAQKVCDALNEESTGLKNIMAWIKEAIAEKNLDINSCFVFSKLVEAFLKRGAEDCSPETEVTNAWLLDLAQSKKKLDAIIESLRKNKRKETPVEKLKELLQVVAELNGSAKCAETPISATTARFLANGKIVIKDKEEAKALARKLGAVGEFGITSLNAGILKQLFANERSLILCVIVEEFGGVEKLKEKLSNVNGKTTIEGWLENRLQDVEQSLVGQKTDETEKPKSALIACFITFIGRFIGILRGKK